VQLALTPQESQIMAHVCEVYLAGAEDAYDLTISDRSIESAEDLTAVTDGLREEIDTVKRLRDSFEKGKVDDSVDTN
jgi:hypothetical protein